MEQQRENWGDAGLRAEGGLTVDRLRVSARMSKC